jgi:hypothetical protein
MVLLCVVPMESQCERNRYFDDMLSARHCVATFIKASSVIRLDRSTLVPGLLELTEKEMTGDSTEKDQLDSSLCRGLGIIPESLAKD